MIKWQENFSPPLKSNARESAMTKERERTVVMATCVSYLEVQVLWAQNTHFFFLGANKFLKDGFSIPHLLIGENNNSALLWWLRALKEMI